MRNPNFEYPVIPFIAYLRVSTLRQESGVSLLEYSEEKIREREPALLWYAALHIERDKSYGAAQISMRLSVNEHDAAGFTLQIAASKRADVHPASSAIAFLRL